MRYFGYLVYVLVVIIVLIPKVELFRELESTLASYDIHLSNESVHDRWLFVDVDSIDIVSGGIVLGSVEHLRLSPWLLSNTITLEHIRTGGDYKLFFPGEIEEFSLSYTPFNPLKVSLNGRGDFGECSGYIDLLEGKIYVVFEAVPQLRRYPLMMAKLRKQEEGLVYESTF